VANIGVHVHACVVSSELTGICHLGV